MAVSRPRPSDLTSKRFQRGVNLRLSYQETGLERQRSTGVEEGTPVPPPKAARYRRDIDGLRAVAVVLVILYHLNRRLAPGGFLGVDIFFVISGFVVTGSVLASNATPLRAIGAFWRRRVLRILPALLLTTVVSMIAVAMLSPPFPTESYNADFRTGISAIFGLGNLYLYRSSLDYFQADASTNPFVHTWSLGVEEQFYVLYALLFIGLIGLFRMRRTQLGISIAAMSVLGLASWVAFAISAGTNPSITYYLIPFRFWEIAAGGLLAYCGARYPGSVRIRSASLATAIQLLALIGLASIVWFIQPEAYPFLKITPAAICAVLLIVSGANQTSLAGRVLTSPVFVRVGLISYSLYLWHYPILLLCRMNIGADNVPECLLALTLMSVAAFGSYSIVELRVRHSKASFAKVLLPVLLTVVVGAVGLAWWLQQRPGVIYAGGPQAWNSDWMPVGDFPYAPDGRIVHSTCDLGNGSPIPVRVPGECISTVAAGEPAGRPTLLLVGDSHAFADWGMAASGLAGGRYRLATLAHDGCAIGAENAQKSSSCLTYWEGMPARIADTLNRNDSVLISVFWRLDDQPRVSRAIAVIADVARQARKIGVRVIVEAPLPTFDRPAYLCTPEWFRTNYAGCSVARPKLQRQRAPLMAALQELVRAQDNVRVWDPFKILCPGERCLEFSSGKPLFRDQNHLSYFGSTSLGRAFMQFWLGPYS
ncbi:MAG: acyltransferase [Acidobacteriota bacterium]|nr:acyltransferase [Acidobacteriota bacterium]